MKPTPESLANLTPFEEGKSGNPNGRPPGVNKVMKQYTKQLVAETMIELFEMTKDQLEDVRNSKTETSLRSTIASVILKCRAKGEFTEIDKILDRVIGKVPQKIEGELGTFGSMPLPAVNITYISVPGLPKPE